MIRINGGQATLGAPIRDTTTSGSTIAVTDRGYIVSHDTSAAVRVAVLPAAATAGEGFYVGIYADGIFPVFLDTNSTEAIDNAVVPPGQVVWVRCTGAKWLTQGTGNRPRTGTPHTVTTGPLSSGAPSFLSTVAGLAITTNSIAAGVPLIVRASQGLDFERWGLTTSNLTFSSLTNTATNYLYVTVGVDGVLTPGSTTVVPVYQESGTPAVTAGLFTFNYGEMKGYLGNGVTAPAVYLVIIGHAVCSGGNVSAVMSYAYNGRYDSGFTATLPAAGTPVTKNHNLGVTPLEYDFIAENTTTDVGYAVGVQISSKSMYCDNGASNSLAISLSATTSTVTVIGSTTNPYKAINGVTGADSTFTLASWKYKLIACRGW